MKLKPIYLSRSICSVLTLQLASALSVSLTSANPTNESPPWRLINANDQTCEDCHPQQVEAWRQSEMGRSFKRSAQVSGPLTLKRALTHPTSNNHYQVLSEASSERLGDQRDAQGHHGALAPALRFTQSRGGVEASRDAYAQLGEGHALTALWAREGALFEAPLTRYEGRWDLSPGYQDRDQGFMRPITEGCLFCHAETTRPIRGTLNRYEALPSLGISCARCHGDARAHVEGRLQGDETPAVTARDACDQCHFNGAVRVTRAGKSWSDHVAGRPLSETIAVMRRLGSASALKSVSQRERLEMSACFKRSAQRAGEGERRGLTCSTCHQPHAPHDTREAALPRDAACRSCHATSSLSRAAHQVSAEVSAEMSIEAKTDCITCHMPTEGRRDVPHLSAVDHWIRARPERAQPQAQDPKSASASDAPLVWSADPQVNPTDPGSSALTRESLL